MLYAINNPTTSIMSEVVFGLDHTHFRYILGAMNTALWDGGSTEDFARLFLLNELMQTNFSANVLQQNPNTVFSFSPLQDGRFGIIGGHGMLNFSNHVGQQHLAFSLQHPIIAAAIGFPIERIGQINFSINSVRFAQAFGDAGVQRRNAFFPCVCNDNMPCLCGDGSQVNALQHMIFTATISSAFGHDIAVQVGNAHEADPQALDRIVDPLRHHFSTLPEADNAVDLLNNRVGEQIGASSTNLTMTEATRRSLDHGRDHGLYVIAPRNGGYVIVREQLSPTVHQDALNILDTLDPNGFPPGDPFYGLDEIRRNIPPVVG